MNKYILKDLTSSVFEFDTLAEAEKRFDEFPNSVKIYNESNPSEILKERTHKEVGIIEINNKCVYLKVPFFQPSDKPEIRISKIGETPDKLRSKMDVIDEKWES